MEWMGNSVRDTRERDNSGRDKREKEINWEGTSERDLSVGDITLGGIIERDVMCLCVPPSPPIPWRITPPPPPYGWDFVTCLICSRSPAGPLAIPPFLMATVVQPSPISSKAREV